MRGLSVLLLVVLLVILPVAAFGLESDNGVYALDLETKISGEEEVGVVDAETSAAHAVGPVRPVSLSRISPATVSGAVVCLAYNPAGGDKPPRGGG